MSPRRVDRAVVSTGFRHRSGCRVQVAARPSTVLEFHGTTQGDCRGKKLLSFDHCSRHAYDVSFPSTLATSSLKRASSSCLPLLSPNSNSRPRFPRGTAKRIRVPVFSKVYRKENGPLVVPRWPMKMERLERKSRPFDSHASNRRTSSARLSSSLSRFPVGRRNLAAAFLPPPRPSFRGQHRPKLPPPPGRRASTSPPSKLSPPLRRL